VIGDCNVGKSALIAKYTTGIYDKAPRITVGCDMSKKFVTIENNEKVKVTFYDTAGSERFKSVTRSFFRNKDGVILAYDISRK
jgi:small GTP-binding protein